MTGFHQQTPKYDRGFTLIELLLYVSISAALLLVISLFFSLMMQTRIKNQTVTEVEQQGLLVMHRIAQVVRNAEAITLPLLSATSSGLTLDVVTTSKDPTLFTLASSTIYIKEGASSSVPLTNSRVIASGLTFHNLSRASTPGIIRIQFTLSHVNPSGRNEYSFTKTFTSSAALRQP